MASSVPAVQRGSAREEYGLLADRLADMPAAPDINDAWAQYSEVVEYIDHTDRRSIGAFEADAEGLSQVGGNRPIPVRGPRLLSERLSDDLKDAWARLMARDAVLLLRKTGDPLRVVADNVKISMPYLSQLANGTGPVPSGKILDKLSNGIRKARLEPTERPAPPDELIRRLGDRADAVRATLNRIAMQRPRPEVRIEGLNARDTRRLVPLFEGLALRCLDEREKNVMFDLLEELAAADDDLQNALVALTRDDDIRSLILRIAELDDKARKGLLTFLRASNSSDGTLRVAGQKEDKRHRVGRDVDG